MDSFWSLSDIKHEHSADQFWLVDILNSVNDAKDNDNDEDEDDDVDDDDETRLTFVIIKMTPKNELENASCALNA